MNTFAKGWYLIYTRPRQEKKVAAHLQQQSIDAYLPLVKMLRQWHDRKKYVEVPLFPSYVFVYLTDMQGYYNSLNCEGALCYVTSSKKTVRVNEKVIDDIRLVVNTATDIEVTFERFETGRQLIIRDGPFAGLSCEVVQHKSRQKIAVHIHCLERNLLVEMPLACLSEPTP